MYFRDAQSVFMPSLIDQRKPAAYSATAILIDISLHLLMELMEFSSKSHFADDFG
jgi:hypothetical protein